MSWSALFTSPMASFTNTVYREVREWFTKKIHCLLLIEPLIRDWLSQYLLNYTTMLVGETLSLYSINLFAKFSTFASTLLMFSPDSGSVPMNYPLTYIYKAIWNDFAPYFVPLGLVMRHLNYNQIEAAEEFMIPINVTNTKRTSTMQREHCR